MNLLELSTPLLVQIWLLLALDGRIHLALTHVCTELRALWSTVGRHLYENPEIPSFLQSMTVAISRPFPTTLRDQIVNLRFKGALTGSGSVRKCELNPDRQLAATYHEDNTLRIHHVDTGACIRTWTCPFDIDCWAWSNDSNFIAFGGSLGTVALLDVATGMSGTHTKHFGKTIKWVTWNELNNTVFSTDHDGGLYAWNDPMGAIYPQLYNETITCLNESDIDNFGRCTFLTTIVTCNPQPFAADYKQTIATSHIGIGEDHTPEMTLSYVHLWRYDNYRNEGVKVRLDNGDVAFNVAFSKCGETIATISQSSVYLWKSPGRESAMIIRDPTFTLKHPEYETITHIVFVDDRRVVTTGDVGNVFIWNYHTGALLYREAGPTTNEGVWNKCISDVCVDDNGKILVVSRTQWGGVRAWNPETGEVVKECRWEHEGLLPSFCRDGALTSAVAVGGGNRVVCITWTKDVIVM